MAVIAINLDDQASAGLKQLGGELGKVATATDDVSHSSAELNAEQQRQIMVIHEHREGTSRLVAAFAELTSHGLELATTLIHIHEQHRMLAQAQRVLSNTSAAVTEFLGKQAAKWGVIEATSGTALSGISRGVTSLGPLVAGVTVGFTAWEAVMARTGKRADELGNITTNLDRIHAAAGGVGRDFAAIGGELAGNIKYGAMQLSGLNLAVQVGSVAWKELDASATRTADQMVINLGLVREAMGLGSNEQDRQNARMEAQREKEKDGFREIRDANAELEARSASRARQEEIASIKTVEGIEKEIRALRERTSQAAQAGAKGIGEALLAEETALEQQRTNILRAEQAKRDAIIQKAADGQAEIRQNEANERQREYARITAETDKYYESVRQTREREGAQQLEFEQAQEAARNNLRQMALRDEEARIQKKVEAERRAAAMAVATEQEKQARLKALRGEALAKAGLSGEDVLGMANKGDVLKNLQDAARERARRQVNAQNQDLRREAETDGGGEASKKLDRLQRLEQEKAARQAQRDFSRGTTDPAALAQAQMQATSKTLGALQQNGKLSESSVQAMTEAAQAAAAQQANAQVMQRQVDALQREFQGIRAGAQQQQQRQRAQAGSL